MKKTKKKTQKQQKERGEKPKLTGCNILIDDSILSTLRALETVEKYVCNNIAIVFLSYGKAYRIPNTQQTNPTATLRKKQSH